MLADPALTEGLDPARRVEATTACEPGRAPWAELLSTEPAEVWNGAAAPRSDRSASLVFTSGTTGLPKACLLYTSRCV